jgi:hypothetical protein
MINLAQVHDCIVSQKPLAISHDIWSLGRLMLEMTEPWTTVVPKFEVGDTLKFTNPKDWSLEATDFLRNTSTVSADHLATVC